MIKGAVLGSPINHSLSPRLHTALFQILEIEGIYEAIEVKSESLPISLRNVLVSLIISL